jgi:flagellum-specific ATP synthase
MQALEQLLREVQEAELRIDPVRVGGVVTEVGPSAFRVAGLSRLLKLGDVVCVDGDERGAPGEVVRIDSAAVTVKSFDARVQAGVGHLAFRSRPMRLKPHRSWKGRVINALGRPVDGLGPLLEGPRSVPIDAEPPPAMKRERVRRPVKSGIRVVDFFTPICAGQRVGVFAGSGVGKSTLLAMLAGSSGFDSVVIALVGERGREVREFLDDALGENRKLAITVVATGDESAMMRRLAPKTAMSVAEYLRDQGELVLLIVDSITRFAHAARDVALASGEPAVARGYAPSVFSELPRLLERAGPGESGGGSITGVFSVLVDGDDHNDPVADNVRGALDGHIVLDRAIADQGRYPAVNVLSSVSRLAHHVWTKEQRALVMKLRGMIARYESSRDLRLMGGYHAGADPLMDQAVAFAPKIYEGMSQSIEDPPSVDAFRELADALQGDRNAETGKKA